MRICSLVGAAMLMVAGLGQQTNSDSNLVIKSSVGEVLLEVVVHDSHGRLVAAYKLHRPLVNAELRKMGQNEDFR